MKFRYFLLPVLALALLAACEKDSTEASSPAQAFSPEDYLQSLDEPLLFQYDNHDLAAGNHSGWFIDKTGDLKSYHVTHGQWLEFAPTEECSSSHLEALGAQAETTHLTVPAEVLLEQFKLVSPSFRGNLTESTSDATLTSTGTYLAYLASDERQNNCNTFGNEEASHTSQQVFKVVILKMEGATAQENTSDAAKKLVAWMTALKENVQL